MLRSRSAFNERIWEGLGDIDAEIAYPHRHHFFDETSGELPVELRDQRDQMSARGHDLGAEFLSEVRLDVRIADQPADRRSPRTDLLIAEDHHVRSFGRDLLEDGPLHLEPRAYDVPGVLDGPEHAFDGRLELAPDHVSALVVEVDVKDRQGGLAFLGHLEGPAKRFPRVLG